MADNKFTKSLTAIKNKMSAISSEMDIIDKKAVSIARKIAKIPKSLKQTTPNGLSNALKQQNQLMQQLNQLLQHQIVNTSRLNNQRRRLNATTSEEVVNQRQLRRSADLHATANSRLVGAYQRLVAQHRIARNNVRNLIVLHGRNSEQVREAVRQYRRLQMQLNEANGATRNFSRGGLRGLTSGFKNLIGAFGVASAGIMIVQFGKDVFNLTKRLESANFALKSVTKTYVEHARSIAFVDDLTERYGVDLITTTGRYTKFLAAAKQSNLTLEETEQIFGSITKTSAVLGLKTDELTGVYLALEQMLSKGKVTTEELRRQLGERLPGAFGIMASALDVTIPQLDKMLKKGEVLSKDALPLFAKEQEKVFGTESVERVNTLVAAQGRLTASYQRLIRSFTEDGNSSLVISIFNSISEKIDRVASGVKIARKGFQRFSRALGKVYQAIKPLLNAIGLTEERLGGLFSVLSNLFKAFTTSGIEAFGHFLNIVSVNLAGAAQATKVFVERLKEMSLVDLLTPYSALKKIFSLTKGLGEEYKKGKKNFLAEEEINKQIRKEKDRQEVLKQTANTLVILRKLQEKPITLELATEELKDKSLKDLESLKNAYLETIEELSSPEVDTAIPGSYQDVLNKIKKAKDELLKSTKEEAPAILDNIAALEKEAEAWKRSNKEKSNSIEAVKGSIAFTENLISKLEEQRSKLAANTKSYAEYTEKIDKAKDSLERIKYVLANGLKVEALFDVNELDLYKSINDLGDIDGVSFGFQDAVSEAKDHLDGLQEYQDRKEQIEDERRKREIEKEKEKFKTLDEIVKTTFDTFSEYYGIDMSKFEFLYDGKENTVSEWMSAFDNAADAFLDASLNRYDIELQEAQRARDLIVNNELSTEKEKRVAREKFEEEERRIKTKRAKAERNNTLIQIGIDTTRGAVLAYLSQLIPGDPTSIPRAITAAAVTTGFGVAQAALVASQPLPKFKEGTKAPLSKDTLAIVGDGGKKEAITENGKLVGVTPSNPTLMMLKKGQEVQKDADEWIRNSVYQMNMASEGETLTSIVTDQVLVNEVKKLALENRKLAVDMRKIASRPVNVQNTVKVQIPEEYVQ